MIEEVVVRELVSYNIERPGKVDLSEKAGYYLFSLFRTLAGREYKVINGRFEKQQEPTLTNKILTVFLFTLCPFVTVPITLLGYALTHRSATHQACARTHDAFLKTQIMGETARMNRLAIASSDKDLLIQQAKDSGDYVTCAPLLKSKEIYRMALGAHEEMLPLIMEGAVQSDDNSKIMAVIAAILDDYERTQDYAECLKKLKATLTAVPQDRLLKAMIDNSGLQGLDPRLQLMKIQEQKLNLLHKFAADLALGPTICVKIQEMGKLSSDLLEQTKEMAKLIFG
jgi:hypothetical protein